MQECPEWNKDATPAEDVHITAGVVRVHQATIRAAKKIIPDHGTLKTWHKMLFGDVVPLPYYAGNFRGADRQRFPCLHGIAEIGGKFGVLPESVADEMRKFASNLVVQDKQLHTYLKQEHNPGLQIFAKLGLIATAVGAFIRIHPFRNGNGRIARLLANYLAYRYDLPMPFMHPSRRPSDRDYDESGRQAMDGNFKPLAIYLFDSIANRLSPNP